MVAKNLIEQDGLTLVDLLINANDSVNKALIFTSFVLFTVSLQRISKY